MSSDLFGYRAGQGRGSTCTEPSTVMVTRSTSCFAPRGTAPPRGAFSSAPSICTACPRRAPSTRAVRTRRPSNASCDPCWDSRHFTARAFRCHFAGLAVKSRAEQVEKKDLKQRLPSQKSKGLPCQFYSLEMFIVRFTSATFTRNTCRSVTTRNLN